MREKKEKLAEIFVAQRKQKKGNKKATNDEEIFEWNQTGHG